MTTKMYKTITIKACATLLAGVLLAAGVLGGGLFGCANYGVSGQGAQGGAGDVAGSGLGTGQNSTSAQTSSQQGEKQTAVKEGAYAPDFSFTTLDGKTAKLSDYQGQVVLLNFWASWCGYCISEMPDMQQITQDYPNVVVLAINRSENGDVAADFAKGLGYDFVWGLDDDAAIAQLYPTDGIPYSIIIDKDGVISTIHLGAGSYSFFKKALTDAGA